MAFENNERPGHILEKYGKSMGAPVFSIHEFTVSDASFSQMTLKGEEG